jgi:hypothetical protein
VHAESALAELHHERNSARYLELHPVLVFAGVDVACACARICSEIYQKVRFGLSAATSLVMITIIEYGQLEYL